MDYINKKQFTACFGILLASISTAHSASVSDLFISEIMANPLQVSDGNGEWIELFNPTAEAINLEGTLLSDDGSNNHTISTGSPLLINPGQYFVMGRNDDITSNGGYTVDYVYSGFTLGNSGDQIILSDGLTEFLRLDYSAEFDTAGISMELTGQGMTELDYTLTDNALTYGLGDIGTPGVTGSFIPTASPVPVPAAAWLFASGLVGLAGIGRRHKNKV
jgi:hypothetical protein